jgi:hypothetical protein
VTLSRIDGKFLILYSIFWSSVFLF